MTEDNASNDNTPQHNVPDLVARLSVMAAPLASSLGLELWGVEVAVGPRSLVRVYVEGEEGVSVEQCADLSRLLGLGLEVEDIIPTAYILEVSSPGLERVFFTEGQLVEFQEHRVEITLYVPLPDFPGRRKFQGLLKNYEDGVFSLCAEGIVPQDEEAPLVRFAFAAVRKARLMATLPEKGQPGKKGVMKKPKALPKTATKKAQSPAEDQE